MHKKFKLPEGYIHGDTTHEVRHLVLRVGWYAWLKYRTDRQWRTPQCVSKLHTGIKAGIDRIYHRMSDPCNCKDNSDKIVKCSIQTMDMKIFLGEHLPGFCPGMNYRPRGRKK